MAVIGAGMRPDRRQPEQKFRGVIIGSQGVLAVEHPDTQFWLSSTIEVARNRLELALGRKQPSIATNHLGLKK